MTTLPANLSLAHDPLESAQATIGIDQRLQLARVAVQDAFFLDDSKSLLMPVPTTAIRNYTHATRDVMPANVGSSTIAFGQLLTFNIGQEGLPNIHSIELHVKLPKLVDAGAANLHPLEGGYAGAATSIAYTPYVCEKCISGEEKVLKWTYGTETLRTYKADNIFVKRQLNLDSEGSTTAAAYRNAVGALPDEANAQRRYSTQLWLPWGKDKPCLEQLFPIQAFGQEFKVQFKFPTLAELVISDVATTANVVAAAGDSPTCFLRLHYKVPEKAERANLANLTLQGNGFQRNTLHIANETRVTVATSARQEVPILLRNSQNPCACIVFTVRMAEDLLQFGAVGTNDPAHAVPRSVGGLIKRPNWTNFHPWESWQLFDGSSAVTDKRNYVDWVNSTVNGLSNYFPCDLGTYIGVIPLCDFPAVEDHGMGHITITSMTNPRLVVTLPSIASYDANETSSQRVIDVQYWERNKVHMIKGNIIRAYNVSE